LLPKGDGNASFLYFGWHHHGDGNVTFTRESSKQTVEVCGWYFRALGMQINEY